MEVYVVMGNDYPDAVFKTRTHAEHYCDARRVEDGKNRRIIYWRVYKFELLE